MDVQNLLLLQKFSKKEKKLKAIEKRQASLLSLLKREYEALKVLNKTPRVTKDDKLMRFRSLRSQYTFKIENSNYIDEQLKKDTIKHSLHKSLQNKRELNERRNKMILAGNSFSQNNKKSISEQSIRKVSSTMSQLQMKREMLARRNEFGNSCTASFMNNRKGSRPSTANDLVNHQSSNPSVEHQAFHLNKKKYRNVVNELELSFKERVNDGNFKFFGLFYLIKIKKINF